MPDNKSRPSPENPWENGWAPDTSRAPGTRRLWLAGALAVATVVACVTAISIADKATDDQSAARQGNTTSDKETSSGLISFASPSASGSSASPSASKSASPSASASASASPSASTSAQPQGSSSPRTSPVPAPPAPPASPTKGAPAPQPATTRKSVRSVNYPDRYWRVGGGTVRLEAPGGSEFREDASFDVVAGLARSSCYSFKTSDGTYLRHRNFVLRSERNDGSGLFQQDATFCPNWSPYSGAMTLQSVNYPNYALRHKSFQLRLEPYGYNTGSREDFAFRLVDGLA
ncbi:AbfB domain-containing protein [Streptomyces sp. NPDC002328]|uniref:AbfB domain-containing protein n=1 Tax=Streptomyces sp. NPDC002328 TaxID=3364642 RepID=UPI0036CA8A6E